MYGIWENLEIILKVIFQLHLRMIYYCESKRKKENKKEKN